MNDIRVHHAPADQHCCYHGPDPECVCACHVAGCPCIAPPFFEATVSEDRPWLSAQLRAAAERGERICGCGNWGDHVPNVDCDASDHAEHFDPDCEECVYLARPTVIRVQDGKPRCPSCQHLQASHSRGGVCGGDYPEVEPVPCDCVLIPPMDSDPDALDAEELDPGSPWNIAGVDR